MPSFDEYKISSSPLFLYSSMLWLLNEHKHSRNQKIYRFPDDDSRQIRDQNKLDKMFSWVCHHLKEVLEDVIRLIKHRHRFDLGWAGLGRAGPGQIYVVK